MSGFWNIEVTDTFGGAPHYSWVHRLSIPAHNRESNLLIARRVKKAAGYTGARGISYWAGERYEFWPDGKHVVVLATWGDRPTVKRSTIDA